MMNRFPSENWWISRVSVRQAAGSLRLQLWVVVGYYVCMYTLPGIADMILRQGVYENFYDLQDFVFGLFNCAAALLLFWYLARVEGGSWSEFWDHRALPNIVCLFLVPMSLGICFTISSKLFSFILTHEPGWKAYCAAGLSTSASLDWPLVVPIVLCFVLVEELVVRGYIITRIRQTGGGVGKAILLSALVYSLTNLGWGIDVFVATFLGGLLLGLIYARWGGLVGFVFGHAAWECASVLNWSL